MKTAQRYILDKATDFAPNVLLARRKAKKAEQKANYEVGVLKLARDTKHLDLTGKDYRDPIFRARYEAMRIKDEAAKKRY